MRSLVGCSPNARHEPLPEAAAKRRLLAVSWTPMLGASAAAPPHMRKEQASPCVFCYRRWQPVGRRDRPRIGAVCPDVRLVSGVGDHITGDRRCPDPVWETACCSVTPAPTAVLHLLPPPGDCHDTPQRLLPRLWSIGPDASTPSVPRALRCAPGL